ncbi:DUF1593 domain-containing protein [Aestuariicella hydrocarbonica]|uniref:DUF1593 domain-containing protein n=1 Tax=Pseudomaricurvus hydrocarbonicus TaxID=1470433 RepID=A0A9E5MNA9_9GAMM|nr:nucleoside hydrolase-like domain-containing protein [Aestuariicella hydrocarbonica]NHO67364.1 DUF1593 domain-containing protein [Aestuariicella hydrocarbonica]
MHANITGILIVIIGLLTSGIATATESAANQIKPRVLVLTDIGNEPDDAESFVRFLLYANEFDIQGIVASTSTWQKNKVQPQLLRERIAAYGEVLDNLRVHAAGYPSANTLQQLVFSGVTEFGMDGVGDGKSTVASTHIIDTVDESDHPLWIAVWGGAADLAQALWTVRASRSAEDVAAFVAKLRIYSISDQDNAGSWIRRNFPQAFYIASVHGWNQYGLATWVGISGDLKRRQQWPDVEYVTNQWLEENIRKGPLGKQYPPHLFIMEGDTPSFLGLIPNGLNVPEHPEFGGWGGRYVKSDLTAMHYGDTQDTLIKNGTEYTSNQASIFRWRKAFQTDFAARIQWSLTDDYSRANHPPVLVLNGSHGIQPIEITAAPGEVITMDATASKDPDGDKLDYHWWVYNEVSGARVRSPLTIENPKEPQTRIALADNAREGTYHLILEVTDKGIPALTRYRRVLLHIELHDSD